MDWIHGIQELKIQSMPFHGYRIDMGYILSLG